MRLVTYASHSAGSGMLAATRPTHSLRPRWTSGGKATIPRSRCAPAHACRSVAHEGRVTKCFNNVFRLVNTGNKTKPAVFCKLVSPDQSLRAFVPI